MKAPNIRHIFFIWLVTTKFISATPGHEVKIEERLLGTNADGFITLRTEHDNLGSNYTFRTKHFLVEYSKSPSDPKHEDSLGAEIKSQLLLDVSTSFDATHATPYSAEAKSEKTNAKNADVILADLLLRFPDQSKSWDPENFSKLTYDSTNGPRLGKIGIAWGGHIKERFVGDPNADLKWELTEVHEDSNCLYFSVYSEKHGQRLVSIPPRKTQQIRDHLTKQPVYLIAGEFHEKGEAAQKGMELIEKSGGKFQPEIWSLVRGNVETVYVVADSQSEYHIHHDAFDAMEKMTEADLTVMPSQNFLERTAAEPLK